MTHMRLALTTFSWLIWRDVRVIGKDFWNTFIDAVLLPLNMALVSGYILPHLGLPADYGSFMLVSSAVGMCFNSVGIDAGQLAADLEGQKSISYELSLPITYWLICIKTAFVYAIKAAIASILILPLGALLFYKQFDITNISFFKVLLMYSIINIFFSFFALSIALWVKDSVSVGRFWIRWGWQLFLLAGFQFSWATLYRISPHLAIINLLNPLVYPFEGLRAAFLGQEGFIDFWACLLALIIFTVLFVMLTLRLFKKRLDCI